MYQVARNSQSDLEKISKCHRLCFPNSFSAKLGDAVIVKTLEWFLAGENRFLFHVVHNDLVIGYVGGLHPQFTGDGSTSGMMRFAMNKAIAAIVKKPWLIFNKELVPFYPLFFKNLYQKILRKQSPDKSVHTASISAVDQRLGLVVIAVHPLYRGKGAFELLMSQFENEARLKGIKKLTLSVKKGNDRAISAYKKSGWSIAKQHENAVEMFKMVL